MARLPKGIRKRGGSYTADVTYGGKRRTGTAPTLEDAVLLRRELLDELQGSTLSALPIRRQKTWSLDHAIRVCKQVAWTEQRHSKAAPQAEHFARFVGGKRPLDTIDFPTLETWARQLEVEGKSDATINRYMAAVSKLFTVAAERGGVVNRPKFPRRKEAKGRLRWLTREEEKAFTDLLTQWGKEEDRDIIIVLVDTGMRLGEVMALEWRDVDFKSGILSAWVTKNGEPRSVPMTKRVRAILESRAISPRLEKAPVWSVSRWTLRQAWDRAKVHLGLADDRQLVLHTLRHTCASRLIQKGVPLKVVQEWLGHKTITVTMRYAHLAPANLMAAVNALEEED